MPELEIPARVARRGAWIVRQLREVAKLPPPLPARRFVSGESWRYLGGSTVCACFPARTWACGVNCCSRCGTRDGPSGCRCAWSTYRRSACGTVGNSLRHMHTRWGSLSRSGRLTLNPLLIHAPKECMDYVILHELCHLREFNHSGAFYTLLSRVLPDRKKCRERLNWNG